MIRELGIQEALETVGGGYCWDAYKTAYSAEGDSYQWLPGGQEVLKVNNLGSTPGVSLPNLPVPGNAGTAYNIAQTLAGQSSTQQLVTTIPASQAANELYRAGERATYNNYAAIYNPSNYSGC